MLIIVIFNIYFIFIILKFQVSVFKKIHFAYMKILKGIDYSLLLDFFPI